MRLGAARALTAQLTGPICPGSAQTSPPPSRARAATGAQCTFLLLSVPRPHFSPPPVRGQLGNATALSVSLSTTIPFVFFTHHRFSSSLRIGTSFRIAQRVQVFMRPLRHRFFQRPPLLQCCLRGGLVVQGGCEGLGQPTPRGRAMCLLMAPVSAEQEASRRFLRS